MLDYPRIVYLFNNGVMLSVVHLFPGEEHSIEALVVGGDDTVVDRLVNTYGEFYYPITDVQRFDTFGIARLIDSMSNTCGGISQIGFSQEHVRNEECI